MSSSSATIPQPPPSYTRTSTKPAGRAAIEEIIRGGERRWGTHAGDKTKATMSRAKRKRNGKILIAGLVIVGVAGAYGAYEYFVPSYQQRVLDNANSQIAKDDKALSDMRNLLQQAKQAGDADKQTIQNQNGEISTLQQQLTGAQIKQAAEDALAKQAQQQQQPAPAQQQTQPAPSQPQLRSNNQGNGYPAQTEQQLPCPVPYKAYPRAWQVPPECGPGVWRHMATPYGGAVMLPPTGYRIVRPVPQDGKTISVLGGLFYYHSSPHERKPKEQKQPKEQSSNQNKANTNVNVGVTVQTEPHRGFWGTLFYPFRHPVNTLKDTFSSTVHPVRSAEALDHAAHKQQAQPVQQNNQKTSPTTTAPKPATTTPSTQDKNSGWKPFGNPQASPSKSDKPAWAQSTPQ